MVRPRLYAPDLVYPEAHRVMLPRRYPEIGDWCDAIDVDLVENCHFCRKPLEHHELMHDRGQGLNQKGTSMLFCLGRDSRVASKLVAYCVTRPPEVEARMNELWRELIGLQTQFPIEGFTIRPIFPLSLYGAPREFKLTPGEWWNWVMLIHADHWRQCPPALRHHQEQPFIPEWVDRVRAQHQLGGTLFSSHEVTGYMGGRQNGRIHV